MTMIARRRRRTADPNTLPRSRRSDAATRAPAPPEPLTPSITKAQRRSAAKAAADAAELAQQRQDRRRYIPVHNRGTYSNSAEVLACCQSVAVGISRLPRPRVMRPEVEQIIDAVHELMCTTVGMIAESRHLPPDAVTRSRQAVADLAVKPYLPRLHDDQLASGSWPGELVGYVAAYDGDLAALLDRALPPDAYGLHGNPSASERLVKALRELDHATLAAEHRLPRVAQRQALPSMAEFNQQQQDRLDAERRQLRLAQIGVR